MPEPEFHPVQIAAWKELGADEKWRLARHATTMLRDAARRRIARTNPDWTDAEINRETARFISRART